jgi:hypothetical protein
VVGGDSGHRGRGDEFAGIVGHEAPFQL